MDSILVTPENLNTQAGKVDDKAADYYNDYTALLGKVEDLTTIDWTGEDATKFREKVQGFEPDFAKMKQLMAEYAQFLRDAATKYTTTQDNLKTTIEGLR